MTKTIMIVTGLFLNKLNYEKNIIIICSYGLFKEEEAQEHQPVLVYFDDNNNIKSIKNAIPEQKL